MRFSRHSLACSNEFFRNVGVIFAVILALIAVSYPIGALAGNGSVVYAYDPLGRIASLTYDTGVIIYYTYDANGNRTLQVVNVNTKNLCLGTSAHGNPTAWGGGFYAAAASGC